MGIWAGIFPMEMNVPDPFPEILARHCCGHDLLSAKFSTVFLCTGDFLQLVWNSFSLCYSRENMPLTVFL